MKEFATHYGFHHRTSSPYYPQGNGHAERAVKTVKNLLSNTEDPWLALLNYRAAPFPWCGLSPAELLFGRRICTTVPQVEIQLTPGWPYLDDFRSYDQWLKQQQKTNYDLRHRVRSLSPLKPDTDVWVKRGDKQTKGTVVTAAATPRSYIVATPEGQLRRNRQHLTTVPTDQKTEGTGNDQHDEGTHDVQPPADSSDDTELPSEDGNDIDDSNYQRHIQSASPIASRTRIKTGTSIRPPDRY